PSHVIIGNRDLLPEKGISTFFHIKKNSSLSDGKVRLKNKVSFNYLGLKDRIERLIMEGESPLTFKYSNIDSYRTVGAFTENEIFFGNFNAQLGASVQGISKVLEAQTDGDDYLFNLQLNANLGYTIPKWNTTFSALYKYIGEQQQFVETTNDAGETALDTEKTAAYSWMDATINKSFFEDTVEVTLGMRNLFDVTNIGTSSLNSGAHSGSAI